MRGADVFVGLSKGNVVNADMVRSMAERPVVFALANPDPEIPYEEAIASRRGRDRGHGPQRPSQPGEQRARLPLHFPRGLGRARRKK